MSTESTETISARRERALQRARRRLRLLEIETHRIKAELARLEAEFEDDLADRLSRRRRRAYPRFEHTRVDARHEQFANLADVGRVEPDWLAASSAPNERAPFDGAAFHSALRASDRLDNLNALSDIQIVAENSPIERLGGRAKPTTGLRQARPIVASLGFHVFAMCVMLPWTIATIAQQQPAPLLASPTVILDDSAVELNDVSIALTELDGGGPEKLAFAAPTTDFNTNPIAEVKPVELPAVTAPLGLSDAIALGPANLGAMNFPGEPGRGGAGSGPGGLLGTSTFFGTKSQGDRFVFVIDNSSSMKEGRLEGAIAELVRSIEALGRKQSFFVIFVSDQTYPMFYPDRATELVLATPENKQRLGQWLTKVQLASGKNRELIKAVDMAAQLRPHAVFLLWDADLRYSEAVRQDVMTHLTRPQPWSFAIHTLGMGTLSAESEQNLVAIAQAHGGTYRRIDVSRPATR